jgi:hypothetical protein
VEAEDFAADCGELERHAFLFPEWPEAAQVADERQRSHASVAVERADVAFDVGQVLVPAQTDLHMQKNNHASSIN